MDDVPDKMTREGKSDLNRMYISRPKKSRTVSKYSLVNCGKLYSNDVPIALECLHIDKAKNKHLTLKIPPVEFNTCTKKQNCSLDILKYCNLMLHLQIDNKSVYHQYVTFHEQGGLCSRNYMPVEHFSVGTDLASVLLSSPSLSLKTRSIFTCSTSIHCMSTQFIIGRKMSDKKQFILSDEIPQAVNICDQSITSNTKNKIHSEHKMYHVRLENKNYNYDNSVILISEIFNKLLVEYSNRHLLKENMNGIIKTANSNNKTISQSWFGLKGKYFTHVKKKKIKIANVLICEPQHDSGDNTNINFTVSEISLLLVIKKTLKDGNSLKAISILVPCGSPLTKQLAKSMCKGCNGQSVINKQSYNSFLFEKCNYEDKIGDWCEDLFKDVFHSPKKIDKSCPRVKSNKNSCPPEKCNNPCPPEKNSCEEKCEPQKPVECCESQTSQSSCDSKKKKKKVKKCKKKKEKKPKKKKEKKCKKKKSKESVCSKCSKSTCDSTCSTQSIKSKDSKKCKKKKPKKEKKKKKCKTKKSDTSCNVSKESSQCSVQSSCGSMKTRSLIECVCSSETKKGKKKKKGDSESCNTLKCTIGSTKVDPPQCSIASKILGKLKETLTSCGIPVGDSRRPGSQCVSRISGKFRVTADYRTGKIDIDVDKKSRRELMIILNRFACEHEKQKKKEKC